MSVSGGEEKERERERGFYLITMRYVILLSSEQTYDGQAERTDAATNITWHPGKRPTDRPSGRDKGGIELGTVARAGRACDVLLWIGDVRRVRF